MVLYINFHLDIVMLAARMINWVQQARKMRASIDPYTSTRFFCGGLLRSGPCIVCELDLFFFSFLFWRIEIRSPRAEISASLIWDVDHDVLQSKTCFLLSKREDEIKKVSIERYFGLLFRGLTSR